MTKKISIIIIHYKADKEFLACLDSLKKNQPKISYEVIIIDNDEENPIEKQLKKKLPTAKYIKSPKNIGFGPGNNLGAKYAKGEYLFFLNPDTIIFPDTIDALTKFLDKKKDAAVVSPLLLHEDQSPFPLQGSAALTPPKAIIALSFINKLFPNNPISKKYWMSGWDKSKVKEVDVAPGTALMIRRNVYEKIGGFDNKIFLYFEEFDLCKRIKELNYKIFIIPHSKLIHLWGRGTQDKERVNKIFQESRFYYFKKHYGLLNALLVEAFTRFGKKELLLLAILGLGIFLRLYRLDELMPFIGDQGWFYISARDMLTKHTIPLVGIASSHPWLHQGALWTYILALLFSLFNFNPITPAYFTVLLDICTIIILYKVVSNMFSGKHALIASLLYTTSPLIIMQSRLAYHTSIIPFFTILFIYSLYKWTNRSIGFFPIIFLLLAILYNLEIATAVFWPVFFSILIYGFWKRKKWATKILNYKTILYSAIAGIIPMLPMLIHDTQHGYPQTIKFIAWIGYKILKLFGYPSLHPEIAEESYKSVLIFMGNKTQQLIFSPNSTIAIALLLISLLVLAYFSVKALRKNNINNFTIIFLSVAISALGLIFSRTSSYAYLPILFPGICIMLSVLFQSIMVNKKLSIIAILIIIGVSSMNSLYLIQNNYYNSKKFTQRLDAAQKIIYQANEKPYNILGNGNLSASYGYLTWWLGVGPSEKQEKLQFTIKEDSKKIEITKKIKP